jgi:hypothetical protein
VIIKRIFDFVGDFSMGFLICLFGDTKDNQILFVVSFLFSWRVLVIVWQDILNGEADQ